MELEDIIMINKVYVLTKNGSSISKEGREYIFNSINSDMSHNYALVGDAEYLGGNILNSPKAFIQFLKNNRKSCIVCLSVDEDNQGSYVDILFEEDYDSIIRTLERSSSENPSDSSWKIMTDAINAMMQIKNNE